MARLFSLDVILATLVVRRRIREGREDDLAGGIEVHSAVDYIEEALCERFAEFSASSNSRCTP